MKIAILTSGRNRFIINIIKVNTEYVKSQKCHVYKRTGKVYNNPHPGSGVV